MFEAYKTRIILLAKSDERIRAVLLNGSRANPNVQPDPYQDFDLVFMVRDFESMVRDRSWMQPLGKPVLQQLPDEMALGKCAEEQKHSFAFLMIFEDGNRIDLTLFPIEKLATHFTPDSLTIVWLDKDGLFRNLPESSDQDYHIQKPGQREFSEVGNEFWWVATYVAKGLKRGEIIYAKEMLETAVRPMFWQLIEWHIGSQHDFQVSAGKAGKFAQRYLEETLYERILNTYADADIERNWNALFEMMAIFRELQKKLARELDFSMNEEEARSALRHIERLRAE